MQIDSKQLAKEWFESALSDYDYAQVGLKEKETYPQIAFLSQQIAEKYIKGFLILNGINIQKIHELPKLLDECVKFNKELEKLRDACELLTGFYTEVRYPPDIPDYTKNEILEAFNNAKFVKETIESLIS
ncbi:MAG: HEPN domain-containing protein [bacterium]|nr:HEPN domain-containing protein [bacterium]